MAAPAVTNYLNPVTLLGAQADGTLTPVLVDANGVAVASSTVAPNGATVVTASSGNVAAAVATAALPAVASVLNYCTGFTITAGGATGAAIVNVTLVGVLGGTMTFNFGAAAGATVMSTPLVVVFPTPIPATAVNTAITLSMPSLGAGNTNAAVMIHGFKI